MSRPNYPIMSKRDSGFKGESSKINVWCRETTFCYFHPLGVITETWMTEGERLSMKEPASKGKDVLAVPASERSRRELLRALLFRPSPMA